MSVSGINSSGFSAYSTANVQAGAQLYAEDSQVLAESLQTASLSATSALTLQQAVSPLLNTTSTLNTLENDQANTGLATLIQNGQEVNLSSAQPASFGIEPTSNNSNPNSNSQYTTTQESSPLPTTQPTPAHQAYTASQQGYATNNSATGASFLG
jgi:hypothetical protein